MAERGDIKCSSVNGVLPAAAALSKEIVKDRVQRITQLQGKWSSWVKKGGTGAATEAIAAATSASFVKGNIIRATERNQKLRHSNAMPSGDTTMMKQRQQRPRPSSACVNKLRRVTQMSQQQPVKETTMMDCDIPEASSPYQSQRRRSSTMLDTSGVPANLSSEMTFADIRLANMSYDKFETAMGQSSTMRWDGEDSNQVAESLAAVSKFMSKATVAKSFAAMEAAVHLLASGSATKDVCQHLGEILFQSLAVFKRAVYAEDLPFLCGAPPVGSLPWDRWVYTRSADWLKLSTRHELADNKGGAFSVAEKLSEMFMSLTNQKGKMLDGEELSGARMWAGIVLRAWNQYTKRNRVGRLAGVRVGKSLAKCNVAMAFYQWRLNASLEIRSRMDDDIARLKSNLGHASRYASDLKSQIAGLHARISRIMLDEDKAKHEAQVQRIRVDQMEQSPMVFDFRNPIVDMMTGTTIEEGTIVFQSENARFTTDTPDDDLVDLHAELDLHGFSAPEGTGKPSYYRMRVLPKEPKRDLVLDWASNALLSTCEKAMKASEAPPGVSRPLMNAYVDFQDRKMAVRRTWQTGYGKLRERGKCNLCVLQRRFHFCLSSQTADGSAEWKVAHRSPWQVAALVALSAPETVGDLGLMQWSDEENLMNRWPQVYHVVQKLGLTRNVSTADLVDGKWFCHRLLAERLLALQLLSQTEREMALAEGEKTSALMQTVSEMEFSRKQSGKSLFAHSTLSATINQVDDIGSNRDGSRFQEYDRSLPRLIIQRDGDFNGEEFICEPLLKWIRDVLTESQQAADAIGDLLDSEARATLGKLVNIRNLDDDLGSGLEVVSLIVAHATRHMHPQRDPDVSHSAYLLSVAKELKVPLGQYVKDNLKRGTPAVRMLYLAAMFNRLTMPKGKERPVDAAEGTIAQPTLKLARVAYLFGTVGKAEAAKETLLNYWVFLYTCYVRFTGLSVAGATRQNFGVTFDVLEEFFSGLTFPNGAKTEMLDLARAFVLSLLTDDHLKEEVRGYSNWAHRIPLTHEMRLKEAALNPTQFAECILRIAHSVYADIYSDPTERVGPMVKKFARVFGQDIRQLKASCFNNAAQTIMDSRFDFLKRLFTAFSHCTKRSSRLLEQRMMTNDAFVEFLVEFKLLKRPVLTGGKPLQKHICQYLYHIVQSTRHTSSEHRAPGSNLNMGRSSEVAVVHSPGIGYSAFCELLCYLGLHAVAIPTLNPADHLKILLDHLEPLFS